MLKQMINRNLTAVALLLGLMFTPVHAQVSESPSAPPGTEVLVKITETMSSKTAKTGDKFVVVVAKDVLVDQQVVIPAGTRGSGTVIFGRPKGSGGVPGALDIRIDSVDTVNGPLKLKSSDTNRGADRRNAGTAASLAFGMIGFWSVQGEELILNAGAEIRTVVATPRSTAAPTALNTTAITAPQNTVPVPAQIPTAEPAVENAVSVIPVEAPEEAPQKEKE